MEETQASEAPKHHLQRTARMNGTDNAIDSRTAINQRKIRGRRRQRVGEERLWPKEKKEMP